MRSTSRPRRVEPQHDGWGIFARSQEAPGRADRSSPSNHSIRISVRGTPGGVDGDLEVQDRAGAEGTTFGDLQSDAGRRVDHALLSHIHGNGRPIAHAVGAHPGVRYQLELQRRLLEQLDDRLEWLEQVALFVGVEVLRDLPHEHLGQGERADRPVAREVDTAVARREARAHVGVDADAELGHECGEERPAIARHARADGEDRAGLLDRLDVGLGILRAHDPGPPDLVVEAALQGASRCEAQPQELLTDEGSVLFTLHDEVDRLARWRSTVEDLVSQVPRRGARATSAPSGRQWRSFFRKVRRSEARRSSRTSRTVSPSPRSISTISP